MRVSIPGKVWGFVDAALPLDPVTDEFRELRTGRGWTFTADLNPTQATTILRALRGIDRSDLDDLLRNAITGTANKLEAMIEVQVRHEQL